MDEKSRFVQPPRWTNEIIESSLADEEEYKNRGELTSNFFALISRTNNRRDCMKTHELWIREQIKNSKGKVSTAKQKEEATNWFGDDFTCWFIRCLWAEKQSSSLQTPYTTPSRCLINAKRKDILRVWRKKSADKIPREKQWNFKTTWLTKSLDNF
jgi:hypothetical protein